MGNLFNLFHLWNQACLLNLVFLGYRLLSSPGKAATRDLPYRRSPGGRQGDFAGEALYPQDLC
jgi:hypothetical protein